jgi:hypothetical protein
VLIITILMMLCFIIVMYRFIKKLTTATSAMEELIFKFLDISNQVYTTQNKLGGVLQSAIELTNKTSRDLLTIKNVINKFDKVGVNMIESSKSIKETIIANKKTIVDLTTVTQELASQKKMLTIVMNKTNELSKRK